MKSKRHGNTDHSVAMGALRRELKAFIQSHPRSSRAVLVEHGKKLLRGGLFEKHEDDYLGYIATNAVSMAEGDYAAATGRSAVTGLPASEPPKTTRSAGMNMGLNAEREPLARPSPTATERKEKRDRAIQRANDACEKLVEQRIAKIKIAPDVTFHDLWELGSKLGKKDDRREVSKHITKAQLEEAGVEIDG